MPAENIFLIYPLPLRWDLFFTPLPLLSILLSLIMVGLIWLFWKRRDRRELMIGPAQLGATDYGLKLFFGWVPFILAMHCSVALLGNGVEGHLFAYNHLLEDSWANWIGLVEILIALSLFYGGFTRAAAILIGFIWVLGIDLIGLRPMLESIQYLGYASFFYLAGRGPYSIDRLLFPSLEPNVHYTNYALLFLRVGVGLNIVILGFTEKLLNIPMASHLIEQHKFMNLTTIPNETFVLIAGSLEIIAGLLIISGIFLRTVSIAALICINASLTITNWNELIDYLPMYAALAILLVWEPNNSNQKLMWVDGLRKNIADKSTGIDLM